MYLILINIVYYLIFILLTINNDKYVCLSSNNVMISRFVRQKGRVITACVYQVKGWKGEGAMEFENYNIVRG